MAADEQPSPSIGFFMACGPGESGLALHTIGVVRTLFPQAPVWVRDDLTQDGTFDFLVAGLADDPLVTVTRNPSQRGYHGITRTLCDVLLTMVSDGAHESCEVLVKLDPDALVASPSLAVVASEVFRDRGPGILGAVRRSTDGGPRSHRRAARNILLDRLPVGPSRRRRALRRRPPFWLDTYRAARDQGYVPGVGVQAGAFALSGSTLGALHQTGFLHAMPDDYDGLTYEEDTLLAMATTSVGHSLHELADTGARWWVQYRPPIPLRPADVAPGAYVLVHPLKDTAAGWALRHALAGTRPDQD